jgi:hypothetical protein
VMRAAGQALAQISTPSAAHFLKSHQLLYRVPVILTLGRFPKARESDSTWRTKEVRHVGSDIVAP